MSDQLRPKPILTTSWDDGHPLDLRIADLLARYGIAGTFYIPRQAPAGTMAAAQLRELARGFEIGAHTLGHAILTATPPVQAWQEIAGSKSWVEDQTGAPCRMFCPPQGRFSGRHLRMTRRAGFLGLRSVALSSLAYPRARGGVMVVPTSVQAHPHAAGAYVRNIAKRAALRNLWLFVLHGREGDWTTMAQRLLDRAVTRGGVFHLWGHSWELQETGQWQRLDGILRIMGQHAQRVVSLTNGGICELAASAGGGCGPRA